MTEIEIRAKSQEKVQKIKSLCDELQVSLGAKQHLDENKMIESIVIFTDNENYPKVERMAKASVNDPIEIEKNVQDTPLQ